LNSVATWVGGGYVIGSAEGAFTSGVVWCQAPFGFGISLIVGMKERKSFLLNSLNVRM
jgi:high affinity choline transporter 7